MMESRSLWYSEGGQLNRGEKQEGRGEGGGGRGGEGGGGRGGEGGGGRGGEGGGGRGGERGGGRGGERGGGRGGESTHVNTCICTSHCS